MIRWSDLQFNVFTHWKLSDEIFFNTSETPIKRAFFWNQKIQKIMTPKGFSTQNRVQKVHFFSNESHIHSLRPMNGPLWHLLCDLLLKKHEFWKKCSGENPIWGQDFWNFSLPKHFPQHRELAGVKISKFQIPSEAGTRNEHSRLAFNASNPFKI
jgi:hypothetical protein